VKGLHIVGVSHAYGKNKVLDNASLMIPAGEVVCLLGPSGSGKTTLLRLAAGLEKVQQGKIVIDDDVIADENLHVPPAQRGIGLLFQDYALFPHLSVLANEPSDYTTYRNPWPSAGQWKCWTKSA